MKKRRTRSLTLQRETLRVLRNTEARGLVGGLQPGSYPSQFGDICSTEPLSHCEGTACITLLAQCTLKTCV